MAHDITKDILKTIREKSEKPHRLPNLFEEESVSNSDSTIIIKRNTPQFGDIRTSMEAAIKKTIGDAVELNDESLVYYKDKNDLVLNGKIPSLNIKFQFRYNDPSGNGDYIWSEALNLTDENYKTIGKITDAYKNWRQELIENGDTMERLKKVSED